MSRELCGGTHVRRAGDIGSFRITSEAAVAAGVRRIEAVTGLGAVAQAASDRDRLRELAGLLKAPPEQLVERIAALQEEIREHRRAAEKASADAGAREAERLARTAVDVGGLRVVATEVAGVDAKGLRALWDALRASGVHVAVLVGVAPDKAPLVAGVAPEAMKRGVAAKDLLATATAVLGGRGGGSADLAQGQGQDPSKRAEALDAVRRKLQAVG
jgi:alanyl-tRNA synthetase